MPRFNDATGQEWSIAVTVSTIRDVQDQLRVNLLNVLDDNASLLVQLHEDMVLLADVLWIICQPQAHQRDIGPHKFGELLASDTLHQAATAFFEALADFFPNPQRREALRKLIAKSREAEEVIATRAIQQIDAIDPQLVVTRLIDSAGSSAASPA